MSKRKPAMRSKHTHSPTIAAKAQRVTHAIVRSPKASIPPSVGSDSNEQPSEPHLQRDAFLADEQQLLVKHAEPTLKNESKQLKENDSEGIDFLSATNANVQAYQAKLLEVAQANMQFTFEFTQRLAAIRSPVEFPSVIAEFTVKRITMFRKHSKEMAELSTKRWIS